jgi:hypothetical protein
MSKKSWQILSLFPISHYSAYGETDFQVSLSKFSKETVQTFLNIERSQEEEGEDKPLVISRSLKNLLTVYGYDPAYTFYSIGAFYEEIIRGLFDLEKEKKEQGETLFCGDPARQVTPEYYYNGAGDIIPVTMRGQHTELYR